MSVESEIEPDNLAKFIFENECKSSNSIQLNLEDCENMRDVFKLLLELFTEGMKIKYGKYDENKKKIIVNLEELEENDFENIKKYFMSFGFDCFYIAKPKAESEKYHTISNLTFEEKYPVNNKTKLSDLKYTINCKEYIYTIYFDLLK